MGKHFVDDAGREAFGQAVRAVEGCSSAEVVIAVRHHSGSYVHADLLAGIVVGVATLAFVLFARFEFTLLSILVDPLLAGIVAGLAHTQLPWTRRWLTWPGARRRRVLVAARATFYEKDVHHTSGHTGILVYISLLERAVTVVADRGVKNAVPKEAWAAACARLEAALRRSRDASAVAHEIANLGPVLAPVLVRGDGDVNELSDEVSGP